jgi:hypothetical protein
VALISRKRVQHILVRLGNLCYDAAGAHPVDQVLSYWAQEEGVAQPALVRLDHWPEDIPRNSAASNYVANLLRAQIATKSVVSGVKWNHLSHVKKEVA